LQATRLPLQQQGQQSFSEAPGYLHQWSQNDQHEFTPEGQEDLDLLARHTAASCFVRPPLRQRRRKQNLRLLGFG